MRRSWEGRLGRWARLLIVPVAVSAAACGDGVTGPSDVSTVERTTSFGFCPPEAYCTTRLQVTGRQVVFTRESRLSPTVRAEAQLSEAEADSLADAAAQARFEG